MNKETKVNGNQNIIIQDIKDSTITVQINGELQTIEGKIEDLEMFMSEYNKSLIQLGNRIISKGELQKYQLADLIAILKKDERDKKRLMLFFISIGIVVALSVFGLYFYNQSQIMKTPIDLKITFNNKTPNTNLPPLDATVTLYYKGELKSEYVKEGKEATFNNLLRDSKEQAKLTFKAEGFIEIDTTFTLTKGIELPIWRDDFYANATGKIVDGDGNPIEGAKVTIQGETKLTDDIGNFKITLSPGKQRKTQRMDIYKEGYKAISPSSPIMPNEPMRLVLDEN